MREWSATFCIKEVTFCIMTAGSHEKARRCNHETRKQEQTIMTGAFNGDKL